MRHVVWATSKGGLAKRVVTDSWVVFLPVCFPFVCQRVGDRASIVLCIGQNIIYTRIR